MKISMAMPMALGAAVLLAACGNEKGNNKETNRDIPIDLHTYSYNVIAQDMSDSTKVDSLKNWQVSGDAVIPEKIGSNDISVLRDSLISLTAIDLSNPTKPGPKKVDKVNYTDLNPNTTPAISTMVNSLSVDLITNTLIVWENYSYEYEVNMAHGISTTNYVNYSIAENKILSLADVMKKGFEPQLLKIIREEVKNKLGNNLMVPVEEIPMPDVFRIKANGIEFIYPVTSIAPYSEGEVNIKLNLMDLEGLLTNKAVNMILGSQNN